MISVITPAHNEENFIGKCLESVAAAAGQTDQPVEHIVVLNRCTDSTEQIARSHGARIVTENARNLSRIRNAGVAVARGEIIVTIDADSWMSPNMLSEVCRMLESGKYVGGGVRLWPERLSLGIFCSLLVVAAFVYWRGFISAGMFWFYRRDLDAVGGFNENLNAVEDVDLAHRLKKHAKRIGKRYGTIRKAHIVTSCRKFDEFGDWCMVLRPWTVYQIFKGHKKMVDKFYYDVRAADKSN